MTARTPRLAPRAALALSLAACLAAWGCDSPSASKQPGPAAAAQVVSGDLQTGPAGEALAEPLVVQVTDAWGRPVPGQAVQFAVTAGGGSLAEGTVTTGPDGTASDTWTLGPAAADTQRVEARAVDAAGAVLATAAFRATATVQAPAELSIARGQGDAQRGIVLRVLPESLTVVVTTAAGEPVTGATVTWRPSSGEVDSRRVQTDAWGRAGVTWTLGSTPGDATATATLEDGASTSFRATALPAETPFIVSDTVRNDSLIVKVREGSASPFYDGGSVKVDGRYASLTGFRLEGTPVTGLVWGALDLSGLEYGAKTATISTGLHSMDVAFVYSPRPVLHVSPAPYPAAIGGSLDLSATCTTQAAPCTVQVRLGAANGPVIATGAGTLDRRISFPAGLVPRTALWIATSDSTGTEAAVVDSVFVEPSTHVSVASAVPGRILEATGTRILWQRFGTDTTRLFIRDVATGHDEALDPFTLPMQAARLTPYGALVKIQGGSLLEWRNGAFNTIGAYYPMPFAISGDWAVMVLPTYDRLWRLNLATGRVDDVADSAYAFAGAVASNGTLAWVAPGAHSLYLFRGDSSTLVATDSGSISGVTTDGVNTAYVRTAYEASGTVLLVPGAAPLFLPGPGGQAVLVAGRLLYRANDGVYLREPDGSARPVLAGSDVYVEDLSPAGAAALSAGQRPPYLGYYAPADGTAVPVGTVGTLFFWGETLYEVAGGTLLKVAP